MEDCAGLLGKTMNSALYWLLHLIDTLLAFVFSITSLISALVAADIFVKCLPHLMMARRPKLLHWKSTLWWPWQLSWLHMCLLLSSPSLHSSQLVLQQTFLWNIYWPATLCNHDNMETCVFALEKHPISASSSTPKGGKRASHVWWFQLLILNYSDGPHDTVD